ncbi:MAG: hypothetical protein IKN17_01660 [Ruminococcus sp.]|nr:hypothetical protein [Ruminococcus sp.]
MRTLTTKLIMWFICAVVFLGSFNLIEWLLDKEKYDFTFLGSVLAPLLAYIIVSFLSVILRRFSGKKKE